MPTNNMGRNAETNIFTRIIIAAIPLIVKEEI